jgi:asparagine synthase (glutamine-hydrolysing)
MAGARTVRQLSYEALGHCRETLYSPEMWESLKGHSPFDDLDLSNDRISRWHPINQAAYVDYRVFLPGFSLSAATDRPTMNSSVETRPPFLDENLIDFCARVHPEYKLRGMQGKWLLRRVAERWLPSRVARRWKQGYRADFSMTFFDSTRPAWVDQLLSPESLRATAYFTPAEVARRRAIQTRLGWKFPSGIPFDVAMTAVVATQLWHHIFCGGGLADLPTWSLPRVVSS